MNDEDLDEMMAVLTEMLPDESSEVLLDALMCTGSVAAAYESIARRSDLLRLEAMGNPDAIEELVSLFPGVERSVIVNLQVAFPETSVDELSDLLISHLTQSLQRHRRRPKFSRVDIDQIAGSNPPGPDLDMLSRPVHSYAQAAREPGRTDVGEGGRQCRDGGPGEELDRFRFDFGVDEEEIDFAVPAGEYRARAAELSETRLDLLRRASELFQRGGYAGRGHAAVLAGDASRLEPIIARLNGSAALIALRAHNPNLASPATTTGVKLDLHGLTVREVEPLVHAFLRFHLGEGRRCERVEIVTGHGRSSSGGARLRPAVFNLLRSLGRFFFTFDNFAKFTVYREL